MLALRPPDRDNLHGQDTGRAALTHASIATLLACEQKFFRQYEERLAPNVAPAALDMSAAFTTAIERGDPEAGARALLAKHAEADESVLVNATIVREAGRAYLRRHGRERLVRGLDVRVRLRNPATGAFSRTFDLVCRVDAVTADRMELVQDRLVAQIRHGELPRQLRLDRRVSLESYALWRAYGALPDQARCRLTLKPGIRQTKKESFDEYLARIAEEYATRPDHYLVEQPAHRTEADFLRLEQELWRWAEQVRAARADGLYPRNVSRCHDFGGCAFLPICGRERGAQRRYHRRPDALAAPPDGGYSAVLADADAFVDGSGDDVVKLTWRAVGGADGGRPWTVLAAADAAGRQLRALGVDVDGARTLPALRRAIAERRGGYYEVTVRTTDGVRETTVVAGPAGAGDAPAEVLAGGIAY